MVDLQRNIGGPVIVVARCLGTDFEGKFDLRDLSLLKGKVWKLVL